MLLLLYPFRYRSSITGKWVKTRYVADLEVIKERYAEFEITGPPKIREGSGGGTFNPYRRRDDARDRDEDR